MKKWFVYIVECSDGTLYTGSTNDLTKRIETHNKGKGAKYTKMRRPVKVVFSKEVDSKSEAFKEEYKIKQLKRLEKLKLCNKQ
jgi:putative endonuclease